MRGSFAQILALAAMARSGMHAHPVARTQKNKPNAQGISPVDSMQFGRGWQSSQGQLKRKRRRQRALLRQRGYTAHRRRERKRRAR